MLVDGHAGSARKLPATLDVAEAAGEHPIRDAGPPVPQHPARADEEADLAEVLAGALDTRPPGTHHPLAAARVPAKPQPDRLAGDLLVQLTFGIGGRHEP